VANVACVRILIQHGADVNAPDYDGLTPLHTCIVAGNSEGYHAVARLLIQSGASLEARDKLGCTPLQMAAERGNATMVEVLAGLGADVNAS
jgi:ankyrin repeat protein